MKNRGIAAGLCICLTFSLAGCGKQTPDASDFVISRTQEEAREEVRRHIEQEENEKKAEEERGKRNPKRRGPQPRKKSGEETPNWNGVVMMIPPQGGVKTKILLRGSERATEPFRWIAFPLRFRRVGNGTII